MCRNEVDDMRARRKTHLSDEKQDWDKVEKDCSASEL